MRRRPFLLKNSLKNLTNIWRHTVCYFFLVTARTDIVILETVEVTEKVEIVIPETVVPKKTEENVNDKKIPKVNIDPQLE